MKEVVLDKFKPREYQKGIAHAFEVERKKFILAILPRRAGKDLLAWNLMIRRAIQEPGNYFYCLPTYRQAKLVIWDSITKNGDRFLDYIPDEIITKTNSQEMTVELINGSIIRLIGSDSYDRSLVGLTRVSSFFQSMHFLTTTLLILCALLFLKITGRL